MAPAAASGILPPDSPTPTFTLPLYGGHDVSNITYWKHYGVRYGKELGKDFITPNGLPYPKLEWAVKKGYLKASTAQQWGTGNIGKLGSASIGIADTAFTVRKFANSRDRFASQWKSTTLKPFFSASTQAVCEFGRKMSARKTQEKFVAEAIRRHGRRFNYSRVKYVNGHTAVIIVCKAHGSFRMSPKSHLRSPEGCPKCSTIRKSENATGTVSSFIAKARGVHGRTYDYGSTTYIKAHIPTEITCFKHGPFMQTPARHLQGHGCPHCGNERIATQKKKSARIFLTQIRTVHGRKYGYEKLDYRGVHSKVEIVCRKHGSFWQRPGDHLNGSGCPACAGRAKLSTREFILRARAVHGRKYSYKKVRIDGVDSHVIVICKRHGEFRVGPYHHIKSKSGCRRCAFERIADSNRFTKLTFEKKARVVHGTRYNYSKVQYRNANLPVSIICKRHGAFEQRPGAHLTGQGCPTCRVSTGEELIRQVLLSEKIGFEFQKRFNDLRAANSRRYLPFDFYLPKRNAVIEFHGRQHFEPSGFGSKANRRKVLQIFRELRNRDKAKVRYCRKNGIALLVLSYQRAAVFNAKERRVFREKILAFISQLRLR